MRCSLFGTVALCNISKSVTEMLDLFVDSMLNYGLDHHPYTKMKDLHQERS